MMLPVLAIISLRYNWSTSLVTSLCYNWSTVNILPDKVQSDGVLPDRGAIEWHLIILRCNRTPYLLLTVVTLSCVHLSLYMCLSLLHVSVTSVEDVLVLGDLGILAYYEGLRGTTRGISSPFSFFLPLVLLLLCCPSEISWSLAWEYDS